VSVDEQKEEGEVAWKKERTWPVFDGQANKIDRQMIGPRRGVFEADDSRPPMDVQEPDRTRTRTPAIDS
jgi:hypothetical protein